jgi:hypothetical protein
MHSVQLHVESNDILYGRQVKPVEISNEACVPPSVCIRVCVWVRVYKLIIHRACIAGHFQRKVYCMKSSPITHTKTAECSFLEGLHFTVPPTLPSAKQLQHLLNYYLQHFSFLNMRTPEAGSKTRPVTKQIINSL